MTATILASIVDILLAIAIITQAIFIHRWMKLQREMDGVGLNLFRQMNQKIIALEKKKKR